MTSVHDYSMRKILARGCFDPRSVEDNFYEANALPSELAGPGLEGHLINPFLWYCSVETGLFILERQPWADASSVLNGVI